MISGRGDDGGIRGSVAGRIVLRRFPIQQV